MRRLHRGPKILEQKLLEKGVSKKQATSTPRLYTMKLAELIMIIMMPHIHSSCSRNQSWICLSLGYVCLGSDSSCPLLCGTQRKPGAVLSCRATTCGWRHLAMATDSNGHICWKSGARRLSQGWQATCRMQFIGLGFLRYVATSGSCFQELFGMAPNSKAEITGKPPENPCLIIWGLLTWFHHFQAKIFWIAHAIKANIWSAQTRVHLQVPLSPQNGSLRLLLGHCSVSTSSMVSMAVCFAKSFQLFRFNICKSAVNICIWELGIAWRRGIKKWCQGSGLQWRGPCGFFATHSRPRD